MQYAHTLARLATAAAFIFGFSAAAAETVKVAFIDVLSGPFAQAG